MKKTKTIRTKYPRTMKQLQKLYWACNGKFTRKIKENVIETIFEAIITENVSKIISYFVQQIQEYQRTQSRTNEKQKQYKTKNYTEAPNVKKYNNQK